MTRAQPGDLPEGPFVSADDITAAVGPWRAAGLDTGDARYLVVSDILETVTAEFNELGHLPTEMLQRIWASWRQQLPQVTKPQDPVTGTQAAERLRREIVELLALSRPKPGEPGGFKCLAE
jgi:hypothetical protein